MIVQSLEYWMQGKRGHYFFFFFFFSGQVGFWGLVLFQKSNCIENKQKGTDPEYHVEPLTHREINDYCLKCC